MSHIQIRIDEQEKKAAQEVLEKMGLNFSSAIKLFFKKTVQEQRLPFELSAESSPAPSRTPSSSPANTWSGFSKHKIG